MKKTIKSGARYQDGWGRVWFAICYDAITDKWLMRLCKYPGEGWFKTEKIHSWKLISP